MDGTPMNETLLTEKRSGSQKRQRRYKIAIACDEVEFIVIRERAQAAGMSRSSFSRASILGRPGPRSQRTPPINAEVLAKATAALNKAGSNLNQIAHVLNAAGARSTAGSFEAVLTEVRAAAADIREIVGRKSRV